jgi:Sulfotransferase domain
VKLAPSHRTATEQLRSTAQDYSRPMGLTQKLVDVGHVVSKKLLGRHRVKLFRWFRSQRDLARLSRADVVFISYSKAGRTWTRVMISRLFQLKYALPENSVIERDNFHRLNPAIPVFLFTMGNYIADVRPLSGQKSPYRNKKIIFLARHPADIAVSFYFHQQNRIKPLLKDVKRLSTAVAGQSIFEYMRDPNYGLDHVIGYMNMWVDALASHENHLLLRYEDLRAAPVAQLRRVAAFLGTEFTDRQFDDAVEFARFDQLKQKELGNFFNNRRLQPRDPANPESFKVRKGKVGGYVDYFTPEEVAWIDERVSDSLDPSLGYGKSGALHGRRCC